jgi:iron only hydrogenase large subunit-like protein
MVQTDEFIRIDQELCTGCRHCASICPVQAICGESKKPQTLSSPRCIVCGQCVQVCSAFDSIFEERSKTRAARLQERELPPSLAEPLFAAYDRNSLAEIEAALLERNLRTLVHCDAAVMGPLAEEFGLPSGGIKPGQVVSALRKLGFHRVYSNTFPSGIAILEQAQELSERVNKGGNLPVINSSCPAAVRFIEQSFPELIYHFSGCRSPRQIAGSLSKTYLAQQFKVDPAFLFSVSLSSCTAHKFEATRSELRVREHRDIDATLTVRELAWMLKLGAIDPSLLEESEFDQELPPINELQKVYCRTGDVAQAVLETTAELMGVDNAAVEFITAESAGACFFKVRIGDGEYGAASVSGLQNAVPFLEAVRKGTSSFRFLELMACPQGCISGGGQPKVLLPERRNPIYAMRGKLTALEPSSPGARLSTNAALRHLYKDFFGKPWGDKSNHVLQTRYVERLNGPQLVRAGSS